MGNARPERPPPPARRRLAVQLLWVAAFCPFLYSLTRTTTDITGGGLGLFDIVRGGGPFVFVLAARVVAPPARAGRNVTEWSVAAFCGVALLSTFWSVDARTTALKAVALAGAYLAVVQLVRYYATATAALTALVTVLHWICVGVAVQFVLLPGAVYAAETFTGVPRLGSLVPLVSANPLAYFAAAALAALLLKVGPAWTQRSTLIRIGLATIYLLELVGTRTRSGLALGAVLILVAFFALIKRRPVFVVNTTLAGLIAAVWLLPAYQGTIATYLARGQNTEGLETLTGRTAVWRLALQAGDDDRWLGLGYYSGHRLGIPGLPLTQSNLDSTWIETLVDVGAIGTFLLALFVAGGTLRLRAATELPQPLLWWSLIVLGYGVVVSFVNPTVQAPGPAMWLFAFGLLATHDTAADRGKPPRAVHRLAELSPRVRA